MRGAPCGLRPCRVRRCGEMIVGNDPCVVPLRGKDTSYRKCRFIPPHQSLTRQLPPKGKPFCKIPFALHDKATRANRKGKPQLTIYLTYLSCTPRSLCSHSVRKASPRGEAVAVATDEGG